MGEIEMTELIGLTKEKKELLEEMLCLSEEQRKIIKNEAFEKLEDVLDKKDKIIEKINEIDSKFNKLNNNSEIKDKDLLNLLSHIKDILNDIKTLDDENNKELSEAMSDMTHEIKDMRQGVRAMQNYGNADPYQSFASQGGTLFIDQDS